jgi:hypothetical protein
MNPGVLIGLLAGLRAINAAGKKGRPAAQSGRGAWMLLVWILIAPFTIPMTIALIEGRWIFALPLLPALLVIAPWPIARRLLVPLGLVRSAFCVAALSDFTWGIDRRGGACLAGAWALARQRRPSEKAREWLERRIALARPVKAGTILAAGLTAALRGDAEGARLLVGSIEALDPRVVCRTAGRLTRAWLSAEAAARGDWKRVAAVGWDSRAPRTRLTRLLGALAVRLLGRADARSSLRLVLRWLWTPRRLRTLPLLRRALSTPSPERAPETRPTEAEPSAGQGALERAMTAYTRALARQPDALDAAALLRMGQSWDEALEDPALRRFAAERSLALGVGGSDAALARMRRLVEEDLAELARAGEIPIGEAAAGVRTLEGAARLLREQLLGELELGGDAWRRRWDASRELGGIDEWREFLVLRDLFARAGRLCGLELRRLVFPKLHQDACHIAVQLWNVRGQRPIGNAIFRWLLAEAQAVGSTSLVELETKNVNCGV